MVTKYKKLLLLLVGIMILQPLEVLSVQTPKLIGWKDGTTEASWGKSFNNILYGRQYRKQRWATGGVIATVTGSAGYLGRNALLNKTNAIVNRYPILTRMKDIGENITSNSVMAGAINFAKRTGMYLGKKTLYAAGGVALITGLFCIQGYVAECYDFINKKKYYVSSFKPIANTVYTLIQQNKQESIDKAFEHLEQYLDSRIDCDAHYFLLKVKIYPLEEILNFDNKRIEKALSSNKDLKARLNDLKARLEQFKAGSIQSAKDDTKHNVHVVQQELTEAKAFAILGLDQNATDLEIKKTYRKLSQQYHPDQNMQKSEEERKVKTQKFQRINEAYEFLVGKRKHK